MIEARHESLDVSIPVPERIKSSCRPLVVASVVSSAECLDRNRNGNVLETKLERNPRLIEK